MYLHLRRTPAVTLDLYLPVQKKGMPLRQNLLLLNKMKGAGDKLRQWKFTV
jgi:hypothetical protein